MQALLEFKFGWFTKERVLFVIGLLVVVYAAYAFATAGSPGSGKVDKVTYRVNDEVLGALPGAVEASATSAMTWRKDGAFFMLLDAPQLELPAPEPPDFGLPIVQPPAYPQPASSGNRNTTK